jgi:hypothetical protein
MFDCIEVWTAGGAIRYLNIMGIVFLPCDQKLASDSSGLSGGFSGQRAWVRKWAPGSFCELVVKLVQLPGQVFSILFYVGDKTNEKSNSLGIK